MTAIRCSSLTPALMAPFLLVVLIGPVSPSPLDEAKILRIKVLEDDRYLENYELARLAQDSDPQVRRAAVIALGRIQREGALSSLITALEDPDEDVRGAASFALGQLGDSTLAPVLLDVLDDPSRRVRRNVIEALGKTGDVRAAPTLMDLLKSRSPELRGEAALALGRLEDPRSVGALIGVLADDPEAEVRWRAACGLGAIEGLDVIEALVGAIGDEDALVAAFAAKGLGRRGKDVNWEALLPALDHPDWRVQVNTLLALGSCADSNSVSSMVDAVDSPNHHVRATACALLEDLRGSKSTPPLRKALKDPDPMVRAKAARALGQVDGRRALPDVEGLLNDPHPYVRAKAHEALGKIESLRSVELLEAGLRNSDPRIRSASASGLSTLQQRGVMEALIDALKDEDWVVVTVAAEGLGELENKKAVRPLKETFHAYPGSGEEEGEVRLAVLTALHRIGVRGPRKLYSEALDDPDIRVRRAAAAVFKEFWGEDREVAPAVFGRGEGDGSNLAVALGEKKVRIVTSRGDIECRLYGDDAPQTVANFLRLAEAGYYDGLTFHRVVPNFVIQGGCARGDGWGGAGYTIRCEINEHRYLTGTLGMALSGKDTGGSQFFITHSPQPHLDGRYTVFGQVVEGMDVVNDIAPGDRILSIEEIET
ncbi:MAG: HEAT repeat domain-containing protein [Candidatus Eisenbacteria sp.]|nr:HEAT repeat domain-containing protein [Candidatus Eisenbacteria bacterium]